MEFSILNPYFHFSRGKHALDSSRIITQKQPVVIKEEPNTLPVFEYYKCPYCPFKSNTAYAHTNHSRRHRVTKSSKIFHCNTKLAPYRCALCQFRSPFLVSFLRHIQLEHSNEKSARDERLLENVAFFALARMNMMQMLNGYHCNVCTFRTNSQFMYAAHCRKCSVRRERKAKQSEVLDLCYVTNEEILHKCPKCSFEASNTSHLAQHTSSRHSKAKNSKLYECAQCSYSSEILRHYRLHVQYKHSRFKCPNCDFRTRSKVTFRKHIHVEEPKHFRCTACAFRSSQHEELSAHILQVHVRTELIASFCCQLCLFRSLDQIELREHIVEKHVQTIWFSCEMCACKFRQQKDLKEHVFEMHIM